MANQKKVAGIAVMQDANGGMLGRIISDSEKQMLLSQFGDDFKTPDTLGDNYSIGGNKSDTGLSFRQLPGEAIFGVILKMDGCDLSVYADKEPSEFGPMLQALGGISTFTETVQQFGRAYSASYPGGSGMWEMSCLPENK